MSKLLKPTISFLLLTIISCLSAQAVSVTTISGTGFSGSIDGHRAIATYKSPYDIAIDSSSNIYVASGDHQIRKLSSDGKVSTFVGAGSFNTPAGIAIDSSGNLYVADQKNHEIKKVSTDGTVTSIAGSSSGFADASGASAKFKNPQGIALDASGNIYVADSSNNRIRMIDPNSFAVTTIAGGGRGYVDGAAASSKFNNPTGIVVANDGTIYVADNGNHRIRKITNSGGSYTVSTLAGGTGILKNPNKLTISSDGTVYATDTANQRIVQITSAGTVSTITGAGSAGYADGSTGAVFNSARGIALLPSGDLVVADTSSHTIRQISLSATYTAPAVSTLAGYSSGGNTDGTKGIARFNQARAMVEDSLGNIYVADTNNHRIRKILSNGSVVTFAGSASGYTDGLGVAAQFKSPYGLAIDSSDNIYVADTGNHKIRKIDSAGNVSTYAGSSSGFADAVGTSAKFKSPRGLAIDSSGNLYVADYSNYRIRKIATDTTVTTYAGSSRGFRDGEASTAALFDGPNDIVIAANGSLFVAEYNNHAIRKISTVGADTVVSTYAGGLGLGYLDSDGLHSQFANPSGLAIDASGNLYVADRSNHRIRKIDTSAKVTTVAGSGSRGFYDAGLTESAFNSPEFLSILSNGTLLVADTANHRIRKVSIGASPAPTTTTETPSNGLEVTKFSGTGTAGYRDGKATINRFNKPQGMAIDTNGNIYVADMSNHRIRMLTSTGVASTIAGTGVSGSTNGAGHAASFKSPRDITIDSSGNLYVADTSNHQIRKIDFSSGIAIVSTFAGSTSGFADATGAAAKFKNPMSITIDSSDNLYVADQDNNRIRKITPIGVVTTLAGSSGGYVDATGSSAKFNKPRGISIDTDGNLYVADLNNHRIRKVSPTGVVTTVAGGGAATFADGTASAAQFNKPTCIETDSSANLYVCDYSNNRIRKITPAGVVTTIAGTGLPGDSLGAALSASLSRPTGIVLGRDGEIYFASEANHKIKKIDTEAVVNTVTSSATSSNTHTPYIDLITDLGSERTISINQGESRTITAFAFDFEDGLNIKNSVIWESDIDGIIEEGSSFNTSALTLGTHTITATAIDSGNLRSSIDFIVVVSEDDRGVGILGSEGISSMANTVIKTFKPKFFKGKGPTRSVKLKAFAWEIESGGRFNEISKQINWTSNIDGFLGQGARITVHNLSPGTHQITADIGGSSKNINIKVRKKKRKKRNKGISSNQI